MPGAKKNRACLETITPKHCVTQVQANLVHSLKAYFGIAFVMVGLILLTLSITLMANSVVLQFASSVANRVPELLPRIDWNLRWRLFS